VGGTSEQQLRFRWPVAADEQGKEKIRKREERRREEKKKSG
jgi:hypothetical protein